MRVLWSRRESTTMDVVSAIEGSPLARNTVMTVLGVLERKGYVKHRVEGRTFIYSTLVAEEDVRGTALESMIARFFGGSAEQLVSKLLDAEFVSNSDRKKIAKLLEESDD